MNPSKCLHLHRTYKRNQYIRHNIILSQRNKSNNRYQHKLKCHNSLSPMNLMFFLIKMLYDLNKNYSQCKCKDWNKIVKCLCKNPAFEDSHQTIRCFLSVHWQIHVHALNNCRNQEILLRSQELLLRKNFLTSANVFLPLNLHFLSKLIKRSHQCDHII